MKEQQQTKSRFEYLRSQFLKDARDVIADNPAYVVATSSAVGAGTSLVGASLIAQAAAAEATAAAAATTAAVGAAEATAVGTAVAGTTAATGTATAGASTAVCTTTNMSLALASTVALGGLTAGAATGYLIYSACKSARDSERLLSRLEARDRAIEDMRRDISNREEERIIQHSAIIALVRENSTMEEERKWHLQSIQRYREENLRQLREIRNKDKTLEALQDVTGIRFVNAEPLSVVEGVPLEEETKKETQQEETKDNETWQSREESRSPRGSARERL